MQREVAFLRPPLATLVLIACVCVPLLQLGAQDARHSSRRLPKVAVKLNGPTTVRPSASLESTVFQALLTNRSAEPLLLFVRGGMLMNARWDWSVTDAKGSPTGMGFVMHGFCGTPITSPEAEAEARHLRNEICWCSRPARATNSWSAALPTITFSRAQARTIWR